MNLHKICRWKTVAETLAAAATATIVTVTPEWPDTPGEQMILIPEAADYGTTRIPSGFVRRA